MYILPFDEIGPTIDKVDYTIQHFFGTSFNKVLKRIIELCGTGRMVHDKDHIQKGILFGRNGTWMGLKNQFYTSRITIYPNRVDMDEMIDIFSMVDSTIQLTKRTQYGLLSKTVNLHNIRLVEIAFDWPFPFCSQEMVEAIGKTISYHLLPVVPRSKYYYPYPKGENKNCSDGAINGTFSRYWYPHEIKHRKDGFKPIRSMRGNTAKVYSKKILSTWYLRFEVTLNSQYIARHFPYSRKKLPYELTKVLDAMTETSFFDFFRFVDVDYQKFMDMAEDRIKNQGLFAKLYEYGLNRSCTRKIYAMKELCKHAPTRSLRNKVNSYIHTLDQEAIIAKVKRLIDLNM